MKKISFITLHCVLNYGSALQTYASQRLFESLGFEAEVVDYFRPNNKRENLVETGLFNSRFWNRNKLTRAVYRMLKRRPLEYRYELFAAFRSRYFKLTPHRYETEQDFIEHPIGADIYCTGSDQIWNSYWNRGLLPAFFLSYAPDSARKISYAASFGKRALDEDEKAEIRSRLLRYDSLTVREDEAVELIRGLGLTARRVLDPTFMLTREQWRQIEEPCPVTGGYVLVYQLNADRKFYRIARRFARRRGKKLVRIGFSYESYLYGGKVVLNPSVGEFLSLIRNAECVLTDSFHATALCLNLNVEFFCYLPKKFSGRISDVLQLFGQQGRTFDDLERLCAAAAQPIDFDLVNVMLTRQREASLHALKDALGCGKEA